MTYKLIIFTFCFTALFSISNASSSPKLTEFNGINVYFFAEQII